METNSQPGFEDEVLNQAEATPPEQKTVSEKGYNDLDFTGDSEDPSENVDAILPPRKAMGRRDRFVPQIGERETTEKFPINCAAALIDLRVTSDAPSEGATINVKQVQNAFGNETFDVGMPSYTQVTLNLTNGQSITGYMQRSVKGKVRLYAPKAYLPAGIILKLGYIQSVRVSKLIIG